jgi:acyl carrier protein phosphodiesterase
MNWLAHIHLSDDDVEMRLGNVLADVIKGEARLALNAGIQRGIACHHVIDLYTDTHPVFLRSRGRVSPQYRKLASVLVDIFYDHFLSLRWDLYSAEPREAFISTVYAQFSAYTPARLPQAQRFVDYMVKDDWLGSYGTLAGIEQTLARVSGRLHRPGLLTPAIREIEDKFAGFDADFQEFYPELRARVEGWGIDNPQPIAPDY